MPCTDICCNLVPASVGTEEGGGGALDEGWLRKHSRSGKFSPSADDDFFRVQSAVPTLSNGMTVQDCNRMKRELLTMAALEVMPAPSSLTAQRSLRRFPRLPLLSLSSPFSSSSLVLLILPPLFIFPYLVLPRHLSFLP